MDEIKKGITLSYLIIVLNNVIRLSYTPFLIRSLGQSEYGLYSLAAATVGYLTIMDLGFGIAIIRYTTKYISLGDKKAVNGLHGMFLLIYSFIGLLILIVGVFVYFKSDLIFQQTMSVDELSRFKVLVLLLIFNLAVTFPFSLFRSIITAHEKFVFSKSVNVITVLLNPLIMTPLLILGYKSIMLIVVMTVLNLLSLLSYFFYCKKRNLFSPTFGYFDKTLLKEVFGYSVFVFMNAIVDQIYWNSGQFILGSVSGTKSVAIYSVAITLKNLFFSLSVSFVSVMLPKVTKMVTENVDIKELNKLFIKVGRIQYIILSFFVVGFLLFGEVFVQLWAGKDYGGAYIIAVWIIVPLTIPLIQNLGITILQAKNQQKFRSFLYLIIAVFNIIIAYTLSKVYGGLGCAIVTGCSILLGNGIIMNIYYHKKIKLDIIKFWKEIIKLSIPAIISVVVYFLIQSMLGFSFSYIKYGLEIILFSVFFAVLMWFLGINAYEKGLITKSLGKVLKGANGK